MFGHVEKALNNLNAMRKVQIQLTFAVNLNQEIPNYHCVSLERVPLHLRGPLHQAQY